MVSSETRPSRTSHSDDLAVGHLGPVLLVTADQLGDEPRRGRHRPDDGDLGAVPASSPPATPRTRHGPGAGSASSGGCPSRNRSSVKTSPTSAVRNTSARRSLERLRLGVGQGGRLGRGHLVLLVIASRRPYGCASPPPHRAELTDPRTATRFSGSPDAAGAGPSVRSPHRTQHPWRSHERPAPERHDRQLDDRGDLRPGPRRPGEDLHRRPRVPPPRPRARRPATTGASAACSRRSARCSR